MYKSVYKLLPFLFLFACHRPHKDIEFPSNETEFFFPRVKSIKLPKVVHAKWTPSPKGKHEPRIMKTKSEPFAGPFFDIKHSHPIKGSIDSLTFQLNELPNNNFSFKRCELKKVVPKIILLSEPKKVKAQVPIVENQFVYGLTELGQDQGLSGTMVSDIIQDKNGLLWLATDNGLCFFNGEYIYTYFKRHGISRDHKLSICLDKNGHIWAAGNGVDEIIPEKGIVNHYGKQQGLTTNAVGSVMIDQKGQICLTSADGIDIFDPLTGELRHIDMKNGLSTNYFNKMVQDLEGRYWLASNGSGVNIIDPVNEKIYYLKTEHGLSNADIRAIICDKKGNIWMGGWNGGVDMYNIQSGKFLQLRKKHGLVFNYIHDLMEDHQGKIWIEYQELGVDIYDPFQKEIQHIYGAVGLGKSTVFCCYEDKDNCVWFGSGGAGAIKYDPGNGLISNYTNKYWFSKRPVIALYEDSEKNIWISTSGQGVDIFNSKKDTLTHLYLGNDWSDSWENYFLDDGQDHVYMGTDYRFNCWNKKTNELKSWGGENGLLNDRVKCALFSDKNVLLGTRGGLDKYNPLTSTFEHLDAPDGCNKPVQCMTKDRTGIIWIGTASSGLYCFDPLKLELRHFGKEEGISNSPIYSIFVDRKNYIWVAAGSEGIKKIDLKRNAIISIGIEQGLPEMSVFSFISKDNKIYAGTARGLSIIEDAGDIITIKNMGKAQGLRAVDFNEDAALVSHDGSLWWGVGDMLTNYIPAIIKPQTGITTITGIDIMGKEERFEKIDLALTQINNRDSIWSSVRDTFYFKNTIVSDTGYLYKNNITWSGTVGPYKIPYGLKLPYNQDHITFHFTGNFLTNVDKTTYMYILEGIDKNWNPIVHSSQADYRNIPYGNYKFKVCGSNNGGPWSKAAEFSFTITPPWWQTTTAYVSYVVAIFLVMMTYNRFRTASLLNKQKELELIVHERTKEITDQKNKIETQKLTLEEKQKEIIDSMNYAKRIQYALLAHEKVLKKYFKDNFVLFEPKDIVSGDFYWATSVKVKSAVNKQHPTRTNLTTDESQYFYLAVCDSTGHGVPGAFMSLLNINFLNEAINEKRLRQPDAILNYVRERLILSISRDGAKDGMDGVLLCFELKNREIINITYSAAHNSPLLLKEKELIELPYSKMPIGKGEKMEKFTLHKINFNKGDTLYLFTDGITDQFGGPKGKKFMYKQLKETLLSISKEPMAIQKQNLESALHKWKGNLEQVDDVTLIGLKL